MLKPDGRLGFVHRVDVDAGRPIDLHQMEIKPAELEELGRLGVREISAMAAASPEFIRATMSVLFICRPCRPVVYSDAEPSRTLEERLRPEPGLCGDPAGVRVHAEQPRGSG